LCGDTRITCLPMMNGNNDDDDDQILLRDIHEGLTAKMSINDFMIHKTCIKNNENMLQRMSECV